MGRTVLHNAAALGHIEVVKVLLKSDATIGATDDADRTALHYAAGFGHFEVVKVLLGSGAAINATHMGGTALHYATDFGHIEAVKVLLDRGTSTSIDVARTTWCETALHCAARCRNFEIVQLLLAA